MILEGIVTTVNASGQVNVAPMGPVVGEAPPYDWTEFVLKPFKTSTTYANLKARPQGVLHVTDDVLLFAQATIGQVEVDTVPAETVACQRLADCCRYFEFEIVDWDDSQDRTVLQAQVKKSGSVRDFFGFNRAMFAVLEAAILASRVHILSAEEIHVQFQRLQVNIDKTAGSRERQAFDLLTDYVTQHFAK